MGVAGGPLFDRGYFNILIYVGSFSTVFGTMMLSLSRAYYQVLLSQGICVGLGCGLLYVPTLALIGGSFTTRRAIAMGIVTSGIALGTLTVASNGQSPTENFSPLGGVVYTVVFQQLLIPLGFAWTVRVIGFIALSTFAIAIPALLQGPKKSKGEARPIIDLTALKDVPFVIFATSQFFIFLGYIGQHPHTSRYTTADADEKSLCSTSQRSRR